MIASYHRDDVFVAGGQPTVTYVEREELHIERQLARAIAAPSQIVSLSGPTKSGKTVLCKRILGERQYVWVDGGQILDGDSFWKKVCDELSIPDSIDSGRQSEDADKVGLNIAILSVGGSRLDRTSTVAHKVSGINDAIREMISRKIILVIDDFHYINADVRVEIARNIKGAVFNGLKVVLLSVTHRIFDAIKAEPELTGRFLSVALPPWSVADLTEIARRGFSALKVRYDSEFIEYISSEAQENPFLMQKFCWEICYDLGVETVGPLCRLTELHNSYDTNDLFIRIAKDAGLPIYQQLVAGPQSRKKREKRPLKTGGQADIYEATLMAIAQTGPIAAIKYETLRSAIAEILADKIPQKHEITSALKHLVKISLEAGLGSAIDWDEEKREVNIADPYLRFYLRWQVRKDLTK